MDGKTKAIIAHLTPIGWIVALILNNQEKHENTSFYLRQNLGFYLMNVIAYIFIFVPVINKFVFVVNLIVMVLWIISLINSVNDKTNPVPVVGEHFQQWFKGL